MDNLLALIQCGRNRGGVAKGTAKGTRSVAAGGLTEARTANFIGAFDDPRSPEALATRAAREDKLEILASRLEDGRFAYNSSDEFRVLLGKNTAVEAIRDAKNPAVGLVGTTNNRGQPTGFASYKVGRSNVELVHIGTDQSQKGAGRSLFGSVLSEAAKRNKGLVVTAGDDAAGFYRRMGMRDLGNGSDFALSAAEARSLHSRK